MKTHFFTLLFFISAINFSLAQKTDFRIFNWGTSLEKVKSEEKASFYSAKNGDELIFKDKLGSKSVLVMYIFNENNKLISGIYIYSKEYSNAELYYYDYSVLLKLLKEKYGMPTNEKETWNTVDKSYDKTNKKLAIADKNLNLYAVWNTERTTIKITLISIGNTIPSIQIHYTSNSIEDQDNPEDLKDALNKL